MKHSSLSRLATIIFLLLLTAQMSMAAHFKGPIGLQLYSLRADFAKDVPGTLEKVRAYGIKNVELAGTYNLPAAKFKEMLEANRLNVSR